MTKEPNIFISWSGGQSQKVAEALCAFLQKINPEIHPFFSPHIRKGASGFTEIENALKTVKCGIACVTINNQKSPWLNYETGCIKIKTDCMCTLLVDFNHDEFPCTPLGLIQATRMEENDVRKMLLELLRCMGLSDALMATAFESAFKDFQHIVQLIIRGYPVQPLAEPQQDSKFIPSKASFDELMSCSWRYLSPSWVTKMLIVLIKAGISEAYETDLAGYHYIVAKLNGLRWEMGKEQIIDDKKSNANQYIIFVSKYGERDYKIGKYASSKMKELFDYAKTSI